MVDGQDSGFSLSQESNRLTMVRDSHPGTCYHFLYEHYNHESTVSLFLGSLMSKTQERLYRPHD